MPWGLSQELSGQLGRNETQGPVQHLFFLVESKLYQQVRRVAEAAGADVAPWLRHMLRAITTVDFPASWRAGDAPTRGLPGGRSHDSRAYGQRFMLRLDEPTRATLEHLSKHFNKSNAEIIRQLVAQATPEAFPTSWRLAAAAHYPQDARPADRGTP
jgi:hypothetical protein